MANDNTVSVDEFLSKRKDFVTDKGHLLKGVIQTDTKGSAPSSFDKAAGTIRMTMSTEQEDRDKDIVRQEGMDLTEFLKNPAAPFAHRSSDFPCGQWKDVAPVLGEAVKRHEGTLVATKGDPVGDRLLIHIEAGSVRACSIGFRPKTIRRREQEAESYAYPGYEILSAELYECSPCLIPANPGALAKSAEAHGILPAEFLAEILDTWKSVDGLLVPRKAFEEERAKHVVGKTFSFGGRTFKATDNGLSVIVSAEKHEESGLLRRIGKLFGLTEDASKDPENLEAALKATKGVKEPEPAAPEGDANPTAAEKAQAEADAKAAADAEELDDDIRELEAHLTAKSVRVDIAA